MCECGLAVHERRNASVDGYFFHNPRTPCKSLSPDDLTLTHCRVGMLLPSNAILCSGPGAPPARSQSLVSGAPRSTRAFSAAVGSEVKNGAVEVRLTY